jgi:hypothetical protein
MVIESVDPFQVSSEESVDTFGKVPLAFKMQWTLTKKNCDFSTCQEYVQGTDLSVTLTNISDPFSTSNRTYLIDISTEAYAQEIDYAVITDQCCSSFEVRPIPQMRVDDPLHSGLNFVPAFSQFNDYQKVAELKISDIRYVFNSYSDPRNKTSDVVFNNVWNNLKLEQKDSFFVCIALR